MKAIRLSHPRSSWALTILVLAISLCRESHSMELVRPGAKSTPSDEGLVKDLTQISENRVSEGEASGPQIMELEDKKSHPVPMEVDESPKIADEHHEDAQLQQLVMGRLKETKAAKAHNAVKLKIMAGERSVQKLIEMTVADMDTMNSQVAEFSDWMMKGHHVAYIDNEADDLYMLLMLAFYNEKLPDVIVTYGGYCYLRHQAVVTFVKELATLFDIKQPEVHMGMPYISTSTRTKRAPYDDYEGMDYVDDNLRAELKTKSLELEGRMKEALEKGGDPWKMSEFEAGMTAVRKLLDDPNKNTAIHVSTSPTQLVHLLTEDPKREKKASVLMTSPFYWQVLDNGKLVWKTTYNSGGSATTPSMNKLLQSMETKFTAVGGGVSVSEGLRQLQDALHGKFGSKLYPDEGIVGLEAVMHKDSDNPVCRILACAGANITGAKVSDWKQDFKDYYDYLALSEEEKAKKTSRQLGAIKMLSWNKEKIEHVRRVCDNFGSQKVRIDTAAADIYGAGILPVIHQLNLQTLEGAVGYRFTEVENPKITQLVTFVPEQGSHKIAVTDQNMHVLKDLLQEMLQRMPTPKKTEAQANLKAEAQAKAEAESGAQAKAEAESGAQAKAS